MARVLNKEDFTTKIAEVKKISKAEASRCIDTVLEGLNEMLADMQPEDKLQLVGYLTLEVKHKPAHKARNPKTKEEVNVPAKNTIKIKAGKKFLDAVNLLG